MATILEQVATLQAQVSALSALVQGQRDPGKMYAMVGSHVVFGCKVTEGYSATDMVLALDGAASGDGAHLNPDRQVPPTRPEEYSNIANVYGETFLAADINVSSLQDANLVVATAPGTGNHRYDIVYIYVGTAGSSVAIAAGTPVPNASTPTDPTLPHGVLALARVHVQANVTAITNADITDLRNFSGRLQGEAGTAATATAGSTTTGVPGSAANVTNSGTTSAAVFDFTIPAGSVIRSGSGAPSNALGVNGDYYLNNSNGDFYLKAAGVYGIETNIFGTDGTNGTVWRDGSGAPSNALGVEGDYYLDVVTGDVYKKTTGTYSVVGNIKGVTGTAATIAVGTVTTGAAGSSATVTNSGTSSAAVFDFSIPRGAVGVDWKGAWSSATAYVINDGVFYNGSSYRCILGHTNQTPPDPLSAPDTYWALIAQKGTDGVGSPKYQIVQDEGTPLTARDALNFVGSGVTVTDDGGNNRTIVTISSVTNIDGGNASSAGGNNIDGGNA